MTNKTKTENWEKEFEKVIRKCFTPNFIYPQPIIKFIRQLLKAQREEIIKEIDIEGIFEGENCICNICNKSRCKCPERNRVGNWIELPSNAAEIIKKIATLKQKYAK